MYKKFQAEEYFELMNDDTSIVNALLFSFEKIIGETVENVLIQKIIKQPINAKSQFKAKFQFKIEGIKNEQNTIFIAVGVCQATNAK